MPAFAFRSMDGEPYTIRARTLAEAMRLADESLGPGWKLARPRPLRVPPAERMWLWRQLAEAARDKAPVPHALSRLAASAASGSLRLPLAALASATSAGQSLADALSQLPGLAEPGELALLRAGEEGGYLADALDVLAAMSQARADTAAHLRLRWIYPAYTAIVALLVVPLAGMFANIRFSHLMQEFGVVWGAASTRLTATLIGAFSSCLIALLAAAFLLVVIGAWRGWRAPVRLQRLAYMLPGYGNYRFHRSLALFLNSLAAGVRARLPVEKVLMAARATLDPVLAAITLRAQAAAEEGTGLAESLAATELLPPLSLSRIRAAEPKAVADTLQSLAQEHLRLADYYARRFVTILEPTLVLILALIIGLVVMSVFRPLYHIWQTVGWLYPP